MTPPALFRALMVLATCIPPAAWAQGLPVADGTVEKGEWDHPRSEQHGITGHSGHIALATTLRVKAGLYVLLEVPALRGLPSDLEASMAIHARLKPRGQAEAGEGLVSRRVLSFKSTTKGAVGVGQDAVSRRDLRKPPGLYLLDGARPVATVHVGAESTPLWRVRHTIVEVFIPADSVDLDQETRGHLWLWLSSETAGLDIGTAVLLDIPGEHIIAPSQGGSVERRIQADGSTLITYPDGTRKQVSRDGKTVVTTRPDGQQMAQVIAPIQAAGASVPLPPPGDAMHTFLQDVAASQLQTIRWLVDGDAESVEHYLTTEQGLDLLGIIKRREEAIRFMTRPALVPGPSP